MSDEISEMSKLKWDPSFSVGIEKYDNQHKAIIDYINKLHDSLHVKDNRDTVSEILTNMTDYTVSHFLDEEVELYKHNYPGYNAHKELHDKLVAEVRSFQVSFRVGKVSSRKISIEIIAVLTEWLVNHILKVDKQYTDFLVSKGVK